MKGFMKLFGTQVRALCAVAIIALIGFTMASCDIFPFFGDNKDDDSKNKSDFVAVTGIVGIDTTVTKGSYTINASVSPSSATNKTITWSVDNAGATEATINGNVLNTKKIGNVVIKATVANGTAPGTNFTKTLSIDVVPIIPVDEITDVPTTLAVGTHTLSPKVLPTNASKKTIIWTVHDAGTTNAMVSGKLVDTTKDGTLKLRATIKDGIDVDKDYTEDFTITITPITAFTKVEKIENVPTTGSIGELTLTGTVSPSTATHKLIIWSVSDGGTTGAEEIPAGSDILKTTSAGTVKVLATIRNGDGNLTAQTNFTREFSIAISGFVPVQDIRGNIPSTLVKGNTKSLNPTVIPDNATNKTIVWSFEEGSNLARIDTVGSDTSLTANGTGTIKLKATIINGKADGNYTQTFGITITLPYLEVKIKRSEVEEDAFKFSVQNIAGATSYKVFNNSTASAPIATSSTANLIEVITGLDANKPKILYVQALADNNPVSERTSFYAMLKYQTPKALADDWYAFLTWAYAKMNKKPSNFDLDEIDESYCSNQENETKLKEAAGGFIDYWKAEANKGNEIYIPADEEEDVQTSLFRLWFNQKINATGSEVYNMLDEYSAMIDSIYD